MKRIIPFALLLSVLIVCGCSKDNGDNNGDNNMGSTYIPEEQMFTVNGVTFKMIEVEGGTFIMGATAEQGDDAEDRE